MRETETLRVTPAGVQPPRAKLAPTGRQAFGEIC